MTCHVDAVVIGGGMAGLVAALELSCSGRTVAVLEASSSVGGAVARHTVGGLVLDAGAESFATARPAVSELVGALGLMDQVVHPNPAGAWVRHEAGCAPLPTATLLGIPAHPLAADVRAVLGIAGSTRALLDRVLPTRVGAGELALGDLVRARMGSRVLRRLVDPVAGGVYSTDPDQLAVDIANPALRAALQFAGSLAGAVIRLRGTAPRPGSAVAGLRGGMAVLLDALLGRLTDAGVQVQRGAGATALRRNGTSWQVVAGESRLDADLVVIAVPWTQAASLLAGLVPAAPADAWQTVPVTLVTLVVDQPDLDAAPRGTGVLVSRHAVGVRAKALTHATAKWSYLAEAAGPGRHVLRLSYGRGSGDPCRPQASAGDESLVDTALADAAELTGVALDRRILIDAAAKIWRVPGFRPDRAAQVSRLRAAVAMVPNVAVVGGHLAGTGLAAVIADSRSAVHALTGTETGTGAPAPSDSPQSRAHPSPGTEQQGRMQI